MTIKWKQLGFIPHGCDDSQTIKYRDEGFIYLCRELRNDWRRVSDYTVRNLRHRPGQGGGNCSYDWTGLDEAIFKAGSNIKPPPVILSLKPRTLSAEEQEEVGQESHRQWVAVRKHQRAAGQPVPDDDLRSWADLRDEEKELYRRSGASLALPERAFWDAVAQIRKKIGEKAFRQKMFEISVSVAFEKMAPEWTESARYHAADIIVKLSGMLDVPSGSA